MSGAWCWSYCGHSLPTWRPMSEASCWSHCGHCPPTWGPMSEASCWSHFAHWYGWSWCHWRSPRSATWRAWLVWHRAPRRGWRWHVWARFVWTPVCGPEGDIELIADTATEATLLHHSHPWLGTGLWPLLGLNSLNSKTSYRQILWSLEVTGLGVVMMVLLWNLKGTLAAVLPRCLSNFRAIVKV